MKINQVSNPVFTSRDLIQEIYKGNLNLISKAKIDSDDIEYLSYSEFIEDNNLDWPLPEVYYREHRTKDVYDLICQNNWYIPEEYKTLDLEEYLLSLCESTQEIDRVKKELELFKNHNMLHLLKFLKYLVDIMRENNIVWGVGRGSSVASYSLYLLGIHKINSIKYNLDIHEFLK